MSAGDWLAATGAVLLAVLLGGLLFALGSVVVTARGTCAARCERLQDESIALGRRDADALRDAENEVDRVDALLTAAESVGDRIDGASRIVSKTVTNPVVKVLAIGTGTKRGGPADAHRRRRAPRRRAMIPKRVFWLDRRVRRRASARRSTRPRKVKAAARRYTPEGLADRVTATVTGISRDVKAAVDRRPQRHARARGGARKPRAASPRG